MTLPSSPSPASPPPDANLVALLSLHADGRLTPEDHATLATRLRHDPAARTAYFRHCLLETHLRREARTRSQESGVRDQVSVVSSQLSVAKESPSTSSLLTTDNGPRTSSPIPHSAIRIPQSLLNHPGVFSVASAAAFIVAGLFLLGMIRLPRGGETNLAKMNRPIGVAPVFVAQFTKAHDCVWGDEMISPLLGAHLHADRVIDLRQGIAELTFRSGAVVLVEGPAKFSVSGKNRGRLDRGKLVARVEKPEAHGFSIETPSAQVVDLGTEFGVEVDSRGATDVAVFDGKVELTPIDPERQNAEPLRIAAGEAVRVAPAATSRRAFTVAKTAFSEGRFTRQMPRRKPPTTPKTPPLVVKLTTADGRGADAYVQGGMGDKRQADQNFGRHRSLWVKADAYETMRIRKAYLRFDLAESSMEEIRDARLVLTMSDRRENRPIEPYFGELYGLRLDRPGHDWGEIPPMGTGRNANEVQSNDNRSLAATQGLTWNNAPGNRDDNGMAQDDVELLARVQLPAEMKPGDQLTIQNADSVSPDRLRSYLNRARGRQATLILVAVLSLSPDAQWSGWRFFSKDNVPQGFIKPVPPTLELEYDHPHTNQP